MKDPTDPPSPQNELISESKQQKPRERVAIFVTIYNKAVFVQFHMHSVSEF